VNHSQRRDHANAASVVSLCSCCRRHRWVEVRSGQAGLEIMPRLNRVVGNSSLWPLRPNDLPPATRPATSNIGNAKLDKKYQQQQDELSAKQDQERQKLQQKQEQDHQRLAQQKASSCVIWLTNLSSNPVPHPRNTKSLRKPLAARRTLIPTSIRLLRSKPAGSAPRAKFSGRAAPAAFRFQLRRVEAI
jgi:hypothetical protein